MKMAAFIAAVAMPLPAATWYAASEGSATNGTSAAPWSVFYAVTNTNPYLQAGDTVIFKDGTFTCTETNGSFSVAQVLEFRKSGTAGAKIRYRSETLWGFKFDGGILIPSTTSNIIVERFHLYDSQISSRVLTNYADHPSGITEYGQGNEILHNLIENTGHPGIGSWKTTNGKYIAGNIIRFVGVDDWSPGYDGANRGSGMYLQNADDSAEALIAGNISYFNYTTAFKAYGNTDIWGFRFVNNINAHNAEAGVFYHLDNYGSDGVVITNNYLWRNGTGIRLGYSLGNGGHSNAVVANNYVVDSGYASLPFYQVDGWTRNTWTNNIGVSLLDRYVWQMELSGETSGSVSSHTIDYNTYYGTNTGGYGSGPFSVNETGRTIEQWRGDVLGDTNSTYTSGVPAASVAYVLRPSTDTNFVHVTVFNWQTNAVQAVNLGSYFAPGAHLAVYDAQNIPTACSNLIYAGGSINLPLTLTNRAAMQGTFSQRSEWAGFDERFRAFVIYEMPAALNTVGTLTATTVYTQ